MTKNKFLFSVFFLILFSIFFIPKDTYAKEINAFRFNLDEENYIESSTLIRLQELINERSIGGEKINFDESSWYVLRKDGSYFFRIYCSSTSIGSCDTVLPLSSYTYNDSYTLELSYSSSYEFTEDFEFVESNIIGSSSNSYYHDVLYSSDNYDALKIDSSSFEEDPTNAFSIDFPIVASNSTFALQNYKPVSSNASYLYKYVSIQNKPDFQSGRSSKSFVILPFDEERNVLLTDDSYGSSKRWTFNSNEFSAVKISYDVLEGNLKQVVDKDDLSFWDIFKSWFGYKATETISVSVDNFIYTVSSPVNLPSPQRFYSTNGKNYKKLPNDFIGADTNFYTKYVDTLNYNDGVRKGYILIDLSSLPSNTEVVFEIEYSTISLDLKGIEKTDDISSLTEFDFSNYYGIALVPKFDYLSSYYRYPIYYQGNLAFGSLYNDDIEVASGISGSMLGDKGTGSSQVWSSNSPDKFSKFLFDLTSHQLAVEQGLPRDYAYLFVKNLNYGKENNTAKIKYDPETFELLLFSSSNSSVQSSNGHNYWSPIWDNPSFGSIDEDGSTNNISIPNNDSNISNDNIFPTSLDEVLAMVPDLFKDLASAFGVIATIFTTALNGFPPIITTGLYSVFILGILILIIKCLK